MLGRLDQMAEKGEVDSLIRSLSRFSEKALLVLSDTSNVSASAKKIGPALIFESLWGELGMATIMADLVEERKFGFPVERALFLTVLHRLFVSGSDRGCERWRRDYVIEGADEIALHQFYGAIAFWGEEFSDQTGWTPLAPDAPRM